MQSGPVLLFQKSSQSYFLAEIVQQKLNRLYGTNDWPRMGKSFYLLNKTASPAVIVEMGFLSNPDDRVRLTSPEGQTQLARAIGEAIKEYLILTGVLQ